MLYISPHDSLLLALIIIWTLPWKGVALWKSAQQKSKIWFVILLLVNTLGLLEILYIFVFSKHPRTHMRSE